MAANLGITDEAFRLLAINLPARLSPLIFLASLPPSGLLNSAPPPLLELPISPLPLPPLRRPLRLLALVLILVLFRAIKLSSFLFLALDRAQTITSCCFLARQQLSSDVCCWLCGLVAAEDLLSTPCGQKLNTGGKARVRVVARAETLTPAWRCIGIAAEANFSQPINQYFVVVFGGGGGSVASMRKAIVLSLFEWNDRSSLSAPFPFSLAGRLLSSIVLLESGESCAHLWITLVALCVCVCVMETRLAR